MLNMKQAIRFRSTVFSCVVLRRNAVNSRSGEKTVAVVDSSDSHNDDSVAADSVYKDRSVTRPSDARPLM